VKTEDVQNIEYAWFQSFEINEKNFQSVCILCQSSENAAYSRSKVFQTYVITSLKWKWSWHMECL